NYQVENILSLPYKESNYSDVIRLTNENIRICKNEWDSFETSWDFLTHPMIKFKSNNLENTFKFWSNFTEQERMILKSNEEKLNKIFIDIYDLKEDLTPEIKDKDITVRLADRERDIKSF